jgi:RNA polymerase sigma factor (sigma-70 family)
MPITSARPRSASTPEVVGTHGTGRHQGRLVTIRAVHGSAGTDDRELAARLAGGDQAALAQVYDRYGSLVFGLARRILRDEALAEDVTQEVFLFLWEHPERFDPARGTLRSWLGLLAHRRSVDRVRAEVRVTRTEARHRASEHPEPVFIDIDEQLSLGWLADQVRAALDQLPTAQRDAVVLAYFGGRTYRDVAAELDIPEGTAKSRLRLALSRLAELLRPVLAGEEAPTWT